MRIIHFTSTFLPRIGGAELVVHNLARHQQELGHDVSVLCRWRSYRAMKGKVPYRLLPVPPVVLNRIGTKNDPICRRILTRYLHHLDRRYAPEMWHLHMAFPTGYAFRPFQHQTQAPCVLSCHGMDIQKLPEQGYGHRLDPKKEKRILQTIHDLPELLCSSNTIRDVYLEEQVPSDRIHLIPFGIDTARFAEPVPPREQVMAEFGIPRQARYLLTVGRNHPIKGFDLIPKILQILIDQNLPVHWILVGAGCESIQQQAVALGVTDHLTVLPALGGGPSTANEMPPSALIRLYRSSDVFLFPSRMETFGMVLLEAMAAGLPVVTTDVPGCRDVVEDGVTGLLAPRDDVDGLAHRVARLLANAELANDIAQKGVESSCQLGWQRVAQRHVEAYQHIAGRGAPT